MKKYFIAYSHTGSVNDGFGSCVLKRKNKIKDFSDILQIAVDIQNDAPVKNVVIINYKRML